MPSIPLPWSKEGLMRGPWVRNVNAQLCSGSGQSWPYWRDLTFWRSAQSKQQLLAHWQTCHWLSTLTPAVVFSFTLSFLFIKESMQKRLKNSWVCKHVLCAVHPQRCPFASVWNDKRILLTHSFLPLLQLLWCYHMDRPRNENIFSRTEILKMALLAL